MKQNMDMFLKGVIAHEGSKYTDGVHPYDPGGPTRWGITLTDARLHWKPQATAEDVKNMPLGIALGIYVTKYWAAVRGDDLPGGVDYSTGDYGVNSGVGRARKVLQRVVGVKDDGVLGAETIAAVERRDPKAIITAMNAERLAFLQTLAIWPTYRNGWTTRVREVNATSLRLADQPAQVDTPAPAHTEVDTPKGTHPEPTATKAVVKASTPTAAAAAGYGWWDWVVSHPAQSAVVAVCVVVVAYGIVRYINSKYTAKQEAPTPGNWVVPELPRAASTLTPTSPAPAAAATPTEKKP
jgi:lysozyme family protein